MYALTRASAIDSNLGVQIFSLYKSFCELIEVLKIDRCNRTNYTRSNGAPVDTRLHCTCYSPLTHDVPLGLTSTNLHCVARSWTT